MRITGQHKNTTLVSIGLIAQEGRAFYAESTEYDWSQIGDYVADDILSECLMIGRDDSPPRSKTTLIKPFGDILDECTFIYDDRKQIAKAIMLWLEPYKEVIFFVDRYIYKWRLFCDLFGGPTHLPKKINPTPIDLATCLYVFNQDPNMDRSIMSVTENESHQKNNALWDTLVVRRSFLSMKMWMAQLYAPDLKKEDISRIMRGC